MRIGHFASEVWAPGGIASFIRRVSDAQVSHGHSVEYFGYASEFADQRGFIEVADLHELGEATTDLDILHLHQEVSDISDLRVPVLRTMHENQATCPSGSRFLRERGSPCNRKASVLGCTRGLVIDRCGSLKPKSLLRYRERYRADKAVLPQIHTHTVSEFLRARMIEAGYPGDRIHTVLHPAPVSQERQIDACTPAEGVARFLFVGRVVPSKGVQWLLRAAAKAESEFVLDIAGDGHGLAAMKQLASQLGIDRRVTFHGWVDARRVEELIRGSRAVVFPSIWHEPAGLVTLEAAANCRPVIASRVGGIPEYANADFALLIEPNDVSALADAMDRLARDVDLSVTMGTRGAAFVRERHTMNGFLDSLGKLYDRATSDSKIG